MNNIGCVIYKKDFPTGQLSAVWNYYDEGQATSGTGVAGGEPGNGFLGQYNITYHTNGSQEVAAFKLVVFEKENEILLQWYDKEILACFGIGIVQGNVLTAGWSVTV